MKIFELNTNNKVIEDKQIKKVLTENELLDLTIAEAFVDFLKQTPYPEDEQVHQFADKLGIEHRKVEEVAYALLTTFFCGGNSKGQSLENEDKNEYTTGVITEYEHCIKDSIFADMISEKIHSDHEFEFPNNYYLKGVDLVNQEKKVKGE